MNKTVDRFKLEEQIQTVWGTKEDLDTLLNIVEEESDNMGATSCDRIMNTIIGIRELHNARSEQLFGTMEEMIHTGKM